MNDPYSVPYSESSNDEKEYQPQRGYLFWAWPVILAANLIFPLQQFQGLPYPVSWAAIAIYSFFLGTTRRKPGLKT